MVLRFTVQPEYKQTKPHLFEIYDTVHPRVNQRIPHKILLPPQLLSGPRVCAEPEQSQGSKGTLLHSYSGVKCHPKCPQMPLKGELKSSRTTRHRTSALHQRRLCPALLHPCTSHQFNLDFFISNVRISDLVLVHQTFSPSGSQMRKGGALLDDQNFSKSTAAVVQGNKVTAQ